MPRQVFKYFQLSVNVSRLTSLFSMYCLYWGSFFYLFASLNVFEFQILSLSFHFYFFPSYNIFASVHSAEQDLSVSGMKLRTESESKPKSKSLTLPSPAEEQRGEKSLESRGLQMSVASQSDPLRRSPRFSTPVQQKILRRSPRTSPGSATVNAKSIQLIKSAENLSLMRSPRFGGSTSSGAENVDMQKILINVRSCPRFQLNLATFYQISNFRNRTYIPRAECH